MRSLRKEYSNGELTIFWQPQHCIHVGHCFRNLVEVFDPSRRPWIRPEAAASDQIVKVVNMCPTQALTFKWNDPARNAEETSPKAVREVAKEEPAAPEGATIRFTKDGPALVTGVYTAYDRNGNRMATKRTLTICRCGGSGNKPFCDGTHADIHFSDEE